MTVRTVRVAIWMLMVIAFGLSLLQVALAQDPGQAQQDERREESGTVSQDDARPPAQLQPRTHPADGRQRGDLPPEAYAVVPGTKFLVRLEDELDTRETREKSRFRVRTLEPLEAGSGIYLPSGAEIRGHVSRVEPAGIAGRAKIWITFDEIRTRFGTLPIVAEVAGVPGDHSVKVIGNQEGLIEGRTSTSRAAGEAAAEAAAVGAVRGGIRHRDKKAAAEEAALAAITAYLMESGRGHELNLPKGAKLELELERALYLLKE
jgi:hypothetical protein